MSSIAEGRPKRATAGNRMAKLLTGEETEKDEFYETAYGGFKETEGDNEYVEEKEAEGEDDTVDSDFDKEEEEPAAADTKTNGTAEKRQSQGVAADAEEPAAKKAKETDGEEESPAVIETVDEPKTSDAAAPGEEATNGAKDEEKAATEGIGVEESGNQAEAEPVGESTANE